MQVNRQPIDGSKKSSGDLPCWGGDGHEGHVAGGVQDIKYGVQLNRGIEQIEPIERERYFA